ncbi:MAG: MFS transporter [Elusimicrobia bacterium]|nr:MFS transporter [Elusimicrobiota bacterium]
MRALLKNRDFLLLWSGQAVSGLGTWISFVGLNLYVYEVFGSGKILGAFMVARMLPALFFGPIGGFLADRYPRRTLLIVCDALRAVLILGFLFAQSLASFFALGLVLSAIDKVFLAAQGALLPGLVSKEDLMPANSATKMTHSVITVLGPAAGGLLVAAFSYESVFLLDSVSFIVSVVTVCMITAGTQAASKGPQEAPWRELKLVFAFFGARLTLLFLALIRLIDALGSGAYNTALPVFSKSLIFSRGAAYGWLVGAWALGEFAGALLVNPLARRFALKRESLFSAAVILMACGMGLTFRCGVLWPALIAIFAGGVGDGISNVLFNTVLMQETPDEMRGKVYGSIIALVFSAVAIGMAVSGFFLDMFPLQAATDCATLFIILGVLAGSAAFLKKGRPQETAP